MQNRREEKFFNKLVKKDYKNELEKVLEKKFFGENAKSLLLEILYKVEAAFKFYEVAKKDAKTKEEYIENYIRIIEQKCKTIKIVKPNSEQSKLLDGRTFIINKNRSEITCLPIARKLLYAISKLDKKDQIVNGKYFLLSSTLSNMINVGDCINTVEPLRDFNGWSWTTVSREIESIEYNLIYQNLIILVGRKFLENWIKNGDTIIDYTEELDNKLVELYGPKLAKEMVNILKQISILLECKYNPSMKENIGNSKKDIKKSLYKFEDKQEYIEELTDKKNKLKEKILSIDTIISDNDLLQKEYVKRNDNLPLDEKIFSIRVLANMMINEREELYKEMEEYNSLLKPLNFLEKKEELQKEYEILNLVSTKNIDTELQKKMQKLQDIFLECLKIQIQKAETQQEIIKLIYQFRYYCLLPYNLNENILNLMSIHSKLNKIGKILIKKATITKTIMVFAQNEEINYQIIKKIFQIRIVNLEDISMKIIKEKDDFFVQFFDEKTTDQKIKLDIPELNKKSLNIRINKKVKLFE